MRSLKQLLERLKTWREQRRAWKFYEKRAFGQSLQLLELQLQEQSLLMKRHRERLKLERKILKSKAKDDYIS